MLWLCLYFPLLPLEVFDRALPVAQPFAVTRDQGRRRILGWCNTAARTHGVHPGLSLSAAHALLHELEVRARDPAAETSALERIGAWASQFSSLVSLAAPQAILLEIGGSRRLFGGQAALLARLRTETTDLGYAAHFAVAPTPTAAWLLAASGREETVETLSALAGALASVPLNTLDLPASLVSDLRDLGLHHLGAVLRLPRDGLTRRFGPGLLDLLDRALGRRADPRPPYTLPPRYIGRLAFPSDIDQNEALLFGAHRLLRELEGFLRGRDAGIQRLAVELRHRALPPTRFTVGLVTPARDAPHLLGLLREHLHNRALRASVHTLVLRATELQPWIGRDGALFLGQHAPDDARWIERLQARLGPGAVQSVAMVPEYRPERAWRRCAAGEGRANGPLPPRPVWLLPDPLPLTGETDPCFHGTLTLERGPERIESGWWDGADAQRDYFLARHPRGPRYWIFRERHSGRWFLHGIFA
jgi:protein ImuB